VEELIRGRPAQNQRGRLRRVKARWDAGEAVSPEGAIGGVRPDHGHIRHAVANLKAANAIPELIDFADDVVPHHEGRPAAHGLRIEVTPDQHVGVLQPRREHADPHLATAGHRQRSIGHLQPIRAAEAPDLKNPVARLSHQWSPAHAREKGRHSCDMLPVLFDQRSSRWRMRAPGQSGSYIIMPIGLSMISSAVFFWSAFSAA
jgi:hypothetical protein